MTTAKRNYSSDYETSSVMPSKIGEVSGRTTKTFTFDVRIDPLNENEHGYSDEFIIQVNGRTVKRLTLFQADRMGLVR